MGSSGGGYFPSYSPSEFQSKIREAEEKTRDEAYEAEVSSLLSSYLGQFNGRDTAAIAAILDKIKQGLSKEFEGAIDLLFGGSVAKHTYVDGLSDVDALLLFNPQHADEKTPEEVKNACADCLKDIFGEKNVVEGTLAVTVETNSVPIQLLPAIRSGDHFKISSVDGSEWAKIRPRKFAGELTQTNDKLGGKLVPTIKLAKAIVGQLPEPRRLSGYHIEALALNVFQSYDGEKNSRSMLKYFFENAAPQILTPIKDITGQSIHVDDYLGGANSIQRKIASDNFDRIARRLKNADGGKDIAVWRQMFEGE